MSSKAGLFGGGGGGGASDPQDSDNHLLLGPDLDYTLSHDVSEWKPTGWMPEGTSLHVYATALFGSFTVFDTTANMQLYSAGLRLGIPLFSIGESFSTSLILSGGPAYLHTTIGDAVGVDLGAGLREIWLLSKSFALVATIGVNAFSSTETYSWGPTFNLGFVLSW